MIRGLLLTIVDDNTLFDIRRYYFPESYLFRRKDRLEGCSLGCTTNKILTSSNWAKVDKSCANRGSHIISGPDDDGQEQASILSMRLP